MNNITTFRVDFELLAPTPSSSESALPKYRDKLFILIQSLIHLLLGNKKYIYVYWFQTSWTTPQTPGGAISER